MRVVYLDLVFLLNAGMDFLLLFLTGRTGGRRLRPGRLVQAAGLGGLWACFLTVNSQLQPPLFPEWLGTVLTWAGISFLMVRISFGSRGWGLIRDLITLFGMTFLVGGSVDALYYHSSLGAYVRDRVFAPGPAPAAAAELILGAVLAAAGILLILRFLLPRFRQPEIRTVCLEFRGRTICLKGLYDTGNRLRDPVFGSPVHVLELEAAGELLTEDECRYLREYGRAGEKPESLPALFGVPYCSVGQDSGMLPALYMEELRLEGDSPQRAVRPMIGFASHVLSPDRQYQMILNPALSAGFRNKNRRKRTYDFKSIDAGPVSVENEARSAESDISSQRGSALYRGQ